VTPAARSQAAIELLDQIIDAARGGGAAADNLIARYFKDRRFAGAKDRREIRALVFHAIRRAGERPVSGRAALLGAARDMPELLDTMDGSPHAPSPPIANEPVAEAGIAPAWLLERFDPAINSEELRALLERATLDLRVNRLEGSRDNALAELPDAVPTRWSPIGLRLPEGSRVEQTHAWRHGLVEIQDEGSQLICLGCEVAPDALVVDLCAGAGGKTLALAAEMADRGRIIACDADRNRLSRIAPRLQRAQISIVETRLINPNREAAMLSDLAGRANLVLVDAPCSGTGTWRRNPETRWRITPERLARLTALQARLLDVAAELVRPGGRLVYAVCSLLAEEGKDQADALSRRSSLVSEPMPMPTGIPSGQGHLLSPARDGTDGFFVARWLRPC
jgi:16S rRNA (cytosine967-C5)-methyltransferase